MPGIRRRKTTDRSEKAAVGHKDDKDTTTNRDNRQAISYIDHNIFKYTSFMCGIIIAVVIGCYYASYMKQLHENDMWFSNIQQLEREISFRTEAGLYFSYYKQLIFAPTISQGIYELMNDNKTEHLRTINILERFNIYQEVILGIIYKTRSLQNTVEYVYFYINTIFGLHGLYMVSLFMTSWMISGSFFAGILSTFFFIFNKIDSTRLAFTIPLRESFGFPFLYTQMAVVTLYFKPQLSKAMQISCISLVAIFTFLFTLSWQFSQFILLLQGMAFFGLYSLDFVPSYKIRNLFFVIVGSLLSVCFLQFMNDMIIRSIALSFALASLVVIATAERTNSDPHGIIQYLPRLLLKIASVLSLTFVINMLCKAFVPASSDEHIFKFLRSKFGYNVKRDFDALLYLCEMSFRMLPVDTYHRLTQGIVFPCYVVALTIGLMLLTASVLQQWTKLDNKSDTINCKMREQPELVYHIIQTVFFGTMAVTTLRFKFLWVPHICVVGSGVLCHQQSWDYIFSKLHLRNLKGKILSLCVPMILMGLVLYQKLPRARAELEELREFYDPDTVGLMEFIIQKTPRHASFSGSMQLLAAVKLCTDRHITNHPHYENKFLRSRTKEVYQIYARRAPKDVHSILRKHGTDYIILENSICYSRLEKGCKLKDILDYDNGHIIEGGEAEKGLVRSNLPRFCDAIKYDQRFSKYFKKVFENETFYVYKLATKAS